MKKVIFKILTAGLCVCVLFGALACGAKENAKIALQAQKLSMPVGGTMAFTVRAVAQGEELDLSSATWSSSKTAVATVDENGVLTAVGVGKTTVTAYVGKDKATCEVEVFDAESLEQVTAEDPRINISNHQNKMKIALQKRLGMHFTAKDELQAILDEDGNVVPFFEDKGTVTVNWTGDVGLHTWTFYTKKKAITAEVCHATHIVGSLSDFAPLSDDWDKATLGNGNELFVHWKNTNATKDWYVVLDNNIDGAMGVEFKRYYTFGRRDAKDGGYAVFNGTFDGRGYALKGIRTERGFITILGPTGVIKNTAFIETRCGEAGGGGVLGWVGFGRVENVFIEADLYYESQHQSGMYWYTDKETTLTVENCLVMIEMKEGGGKWPSGDWNNPGFFSTNGVDNGNAETTVIDSYGISTCFTRVDGARDNTEGIVFRSYTDWLAANVYAKFGSLWEFGPETIFFGGELVFSLNG